MKEFLSSTDCFTLCLKPIIATFNQKLSKLCVKFYFPVKTDAIVENHLFVYKTGYSQSELNKTRINPDVYNLFCISLINFVNTGLYLWSAWFTSFLITIHEPAKV